MDLSIAQWIQCCASVVIILFPLQGCGVLKPTGCFCSTLQPAAAHAGVTGRFICTTDHMLEGEEGKGGGGGVVGGWGRV